jgi:hypothetical protein
MGDTAGTTRAPIGAILAIVGGALLAVGSFLSWAEVSGAGTSVSAKGIDGSDGYITLVAGIIALGVGAAMMKQAKRVLAVLAVLAGLIGGGVGLYDALTAKDSVLDAAAEEIAPTLGASAEEVRALLDQAIDSGELSISISIGLYIVIGGGVLALVGGVMSMRGGGASSAAPAGFTSGSAMTAGAPPPMPATPPSEPTAPPPSEPTAPPGDPTPG